MSIKFECPKCHNQLEAENDYVGMKLDCPQCNQEIIVPKPSLKVTNQEVNANLSPNTKETSPEDKTNTVNLFDFKNASSRDVDVAYRVIGSRTNEMLRARFFEWFLARKKNLSDLNKCLLPSEQVLAFVSGRMLVKIGGQVNGKNGMIGGLLVLTDKRIIFLNCFKQDSIMLNKINSISGQMSGMLGEITITESAGCRVFDWVNKKGVFAFVEMVQNTIDGNYQHYIYTIGNKSTPDLKMANQVITPQEEKSDGSKNKKNYKKWGCGCLFIFLFAGLIGSFAKKESSESSSSSLDTSRRNVVSEQPKKIINNDVVSEQPKKIINSDVGAEKPKKTILQMWSEFKPEQLNNGGWSSPLGGIPLVKGYAERFPQFELIRDHFVTSDTCYMHGIVTGSLSGYLSQENIVVIKPGLTYLNWDGKYPTYYLIVTISGIDVNNRERAFYYRFTCDSQTGKIKELNSHNELIKNRELFLKMDADNIKALYQKFNAINDEKFKILFEQYRKSAESGDAEGQCNLGRSYDTGEGVAKDQIEAIKWYRKAAEQGYARAQYNLGCCYFFNGIGITKDEAEAMKWWRKAAEQGFARAQFNLGLGYCNGTGVAIDKAEAVKWWRKAAEQGFADAQHELGLCYYNGIGIAKDEAEGKKWVQKAATQMR